MRRSPHERNGRVAPAVVGLCVMAFLAHGEDPNHGPYAVNIKRGIDFILDQQDEKQNGDDARKEH